MSNLGPRSREENAISRQLESLLLFQTDVIKIFFCVVKHPHFVKRIMEFGPQYQISSNE